MLFHAHSRLAEWFDAAQIAERASSGEQDRLIGHRVQNSTTMYRVMEKIVGRGLGIMEHIDLEECSDQVREFKYCL